MGLSAGMQASLSLGAQGLGAGMSAVGSYYSAKGQKTAMKLQARMDELNARMAEGQARDVLRQGERAEQAVRMKGAQVKSAQRVAMGASGVDLASDTAVALQTSTDVLNEIDANTVKANALRAAWGHRMDAVTYKGQARVGRATARSISPFMQAGTSLLTDSVSIYDSYKSFKSSGAIK
jgi:DNA gyrase/topoisomerase IV subunit A